LREPQDFEKWLKNLREEGVEHGIGYRYARITSASEREWTFAEKYLDVFSATRGILAEIRFVSQCECFQDK